jgi:hypothetical protein
MPISEINLDLGSTIQPFHLSSAGSTPNNDKYLLNDIKEPTPCTLTMKRHFHNNSLISCEKMPQYVVQMPILEINLDLGFTIQPFPPSSASFAPNKDKYP